MTPPELPRPDRGPSGYLVVAATMVLACPAALLVWAWAAWARPRVAGWVLPALAVVVAGVAVELHGPLAGAYATLGGDLVAIPAAHGLRPSWAALWAGVALLARSVVLTAPVGVPVGLAAAMVGKSAEPRRLSPPPATVRRVERVDTQHSEFLAAAFNLPGQPPGDLGPEWYRGRYLVLPDREAGLTRLVLGRPGRGKTVYLLRESYLAGRARRRLTLVDCKGQAGLAGEVVAAYRAGWADNLTRTSTLGWEQTGPTVHLWPDEPLNGWTGGPVAVANRLLACWTFDLASQWYREVVAMTLRLALHAPGAEVASSADLLHRMQPGVLARLWEEHPDESALVRSLSKDHRLDDVCIRVANLMASLGSTLDGARPLGTADCTVLSLPVAAAEHDAAAILRVTLADLAHHVAIRKDPAVLETIIVDEFSAVAGGRDHAVHLAERGRSAAVAVVLAVQSNRGLGDDHEADRLVGAAGVFVVFAIAEPERVIGWAGTRRQIEETSTSIHDTGGSSTTSARVWRDQVDPNVVRALGPGQAYILSGGRAQLCHVIRPPGGDGPLPTAAAAGTPEPSGGSARAVDRRGYPALPGRVKGAPTAHPSGQTLDPSTRAGSGDTVAPGGRDHPPDDRQPTPPGGTL
jgi:hypothetical protein